MEQDCIAGLYHSLDMSVGAEFSTEDVSVLYRKVFHLPSNINEAHAAMKKMAGDDNSWSCVGENVLDVLLEMEREKEKKEMLYWDLQLINAGNLNHMMDCMLQSTNPNTFRKAYSSDSGSLQPSTIEMDGPQVMRVERKKELGGRSTGVRRLKKAARQCWASLASDGVQSILPSPWLSQRLRIRGQAWGCVSLCDVLLLVEVKYDVVMHLLYTEMLQEHHTESAWKTLLPWQQQKEVEALEDLAEEALESVDMLHLAELPGAFRIYKADLGASFGSCPESKELSWSAVSLLNELHTVRQQEQDTLIVLCERLRGESLRLLCLYVKLATLRAQREKMSYSAFLAARQSWETWPQVNGPCRAEQVALWLQGEDEDEVKEEKEDFKTLQQQAVLQLLVLTQEQERKHLVRLIHGVSLEELQGPGCAVPPRDDSHKQAALRNGCIKRLRQIHTCLQPHTGAQTPLEQTNPQPQLKSQLLLEDCALPLLTHLVELQEVQVSALLQVLMNTNAECLQALRDQYESEIQAQHFTNLLHLLTSDVPLRSVLTHYPNSIENKSNDQVIAQSPYTGKVDVQNVRGGSAEAQRPEPQVKAPTDGTDKQDVCSGCGAVMEDLPYLEILCVSDTKNDAHDGLAAAEGEEEGSATKISQSYEKQGSLITLAWSKPPEDEKDCEAEAADGDAGQSQDADNGLTRVQSAHCEETIQERDREELKPTLLQSQSADQQYSPVEQLTLNKRPIADQPEQRGADSLVAENLQALRPSLLTDSSETNRHADDLCSDDTTNDGRDEVEICPAATESELWVLRGPEPCDHDDKKYSPELKLDREVSGRKAAMREPTLMEREWTREPVSTVERERTMRNLVDMQRKVERRQQRDRERQLLRVQERLSIIQNRKAEEDLLGLKHTDRLRHLTQDLPLEDKNQQKTIVRERLEQLRRERSYIMHSKRDRNTAGFKELLGPVALHTRETEDRADEENTAV